MSDAAIRSTRRISSRHSMNGKSQKRYSMSLRRNRFLLIVRCGTSRISTSRRTWPDIYLPTESSRYLPKIIADFARGKTFYTALILQKDIRHEKRRVREIGRRRIRTSAEMGAGENKECCVAR